MALLSRLKRRPWLWASTSAYSMVGGAWPLVAPRHYERITGHKSDKWLMSAISLHFEVTAAVMARAALTERVTPEVATLVVGSSLSMAGLSLVNVARGRIPSVYLMDAVGHLVLCAGWIAGARRPGALRRNVGRPAKGPAAMVSFGQIAYFTFGSIWPLLGSKSFQEVTGPKKDMWLQKDLALLLGVDALVIGKANRNQRLTPEIILLGGGASTVLASVSVVNVIRGRIFRLYLLDALAQASICNRVAPGISRKTECGHRSRRTTCAGTLGIDFSAGSTQLIRA